MPDGFTGRDRLNLNNVCRDVQWMKEQHEKRMDEIEERRVSGERRLHERVDEVHHRVNGVRKLFTVATVIAGAIGASIAGYFKIRSN